jgi:hypothetical protein
MKFIRNFSLLLLSFFNVAQWNAQILTGPTLEFTHPAIVDGLGMDQFAGYADEAFISPGDINGDGLVDFVRGMRNMWGTNGIGFWINNGTSPNLSFSYAGDNPYGIVTASSGSMIHTDLWDFDNDGDLDIFAISPDIEGLMLWENTGTSTTPVFSNHTVLYTEIFGFSKSLTIADYNGDGLKDLIVGKFDSDLGYHYVLVSINVGEPGAPVFANALTNPDGIDVSALTATSWNTPNLTFFDWDTDGDLDIFGMSETDNQVFYLVNSGSSTVPIYGVAEYQFSISSWYNSNFEFLDINSDGILEALLGQSTGRVFVMNQVFAGCMDSGACNYDPNALVWDDSCIYATTYYLDADGDGYGTASSTYYGCDPTEQYVSNYNDCDDSNGDVTGPPGDPSVFGQGVWNAYVFEGTSFDNYKGYYVREGNSYNTVSDFGSEGSPSEAVGYLGCSVPTEYHSLKYKRQGFPSSDFQYSITIPSWDDDVYVYVDGNLVWYTGCCNSNYMDNVVWTGTLNESSTVEIDYVEYWGGSYLHFIVEPDYPLSITGSNYISNNACYTFDLYTNVNQDFGIDPSTMTYSINSANGLIDEIDFTTDFNGSEVVFHLNPMEVLGEDVLTIVVQDNMGYSDTLLVNVSLYECPAPLEIYGSDDLYHDACTDFDIYLGINSSLGYIRDEMTVVTTFENPEFVQSNTPVFIDGWNNGAYIYFLATGLQGNTTATTIVTDPVGNSDTLITYLTFGNCYPYFDVQNDYQLTCGDSVGTMSITYAFHEIGVSQSIQYIESNNTYTVPNENIVLVSTIDTTIVDNGIAFYGTTYLYEFEYENLGDWNEIYGAMSDDYGYNYSFSTYSESFLDYNSPQLSSSTTDLEIVLPAGACETEISWEVLNNPINAFGAGSTYLTNQHNGTFYAAINAGNGLSYMGVDGNSGADGDGSVEEISFTVSAPSGDEYNVFTAVFDGDGDPWIYPMWIAPVNESGITTSIDEYLSDSRLVLEGLSGNANPFFYYLFASDNNEEPYGVTELQSVAQMLVNGFDAHINDGVFNLANLSDAMGGIVTDINSTVLNNGSYYVIDIQDDFEYDSNDQPVGINDGTGDIYDGGNFLVTNFNDYYYYGEEGSGIPYTNGLVYSGGPSESDEIFSVFVSEQCSYELSSSIPNGSTLQTGLTVIEFTATDLAGNVSFHSVNVNVIPFNDTEVCGNLMDDNCDGLTDNDCALPGCTDLTACNYDEFATEDDGSCILPQEEICNEVDDDCDGEVDEYVLNTYYVDADEDGFGSSETAVYACTMPLGYVDNFEDCDDALLTYLDLDGDGVGSEILDDCGVLSHDDCDDSNGSISPDAEEICGNTMDENCDGVDEICVVSGCTDPTAFNYDPAANEDDGSCIAVVYGCTDATAFNYDAAANTDDGSCIEVVNGCTDVEAYNYNPAANTDDGSCVAFVYGCTDPSAYNYDATANTDDGSCIEVVNGCTDATACNFNELANVEDGSCILPIAESCNGIDDNCDGEVDEFVLNTYYADADGDGFGNVENQTFACSVQAGFVDNFDDCDDSALTYQDVDNDGFGSAVADACGVINQDDCADNDASISPNGIEVCGNSVDEDCNGIDEICIINGCTDVNACNYNENANTEDGTCTYPTESYLNCAGSCLNDADADGVCDEVELAGCTDVTACNYDEAATEDDGSCVLPTVEICNDLDDNCNGEIDEFVTNVYYLDTDGDGFGNAQEIVMSCSAPNGYVDNGDDCDDAIVTFEDLDNDGYGSSIVTACGISSNTDCDDNDANVNSGSTEICNGLDEDCDGIVDNGLSFMNYFTDSDADGYGTGDAMSYCSNPGAGYSTSNDDCDDLNAGINPGATEIDGNDVDENCDGEVLSVNTTEVVIEMYPNPTRNQFSVVNTSAQRSELIIYNAQGKLVFKTTMTEHKLMIDCSSWSAGMYMVHMQNAGTIQSATLIVQ